MKNTIIVVADLGSFKAYKFDSDQQNTTPSLQQMEVPNTPGEHTKRSNTLTVMEGKSSSGNPGANTTASDGEQHHMQLEKRRRAIRQICDNVRHLLGTSPDAKCLIAAPKEILPQVLETLDGAAKGRIQKTLPLDLTGVPKSGLVRHFYPDGLKFGSLAKA